MFIKKGIKRRKHRRLITTEYQIATLMSKKTPSSSKKQQQQLRSGPKDVPSPSRANTMEDGDGSQFLDIVVAEPWEGSEYSNEDGISSSQSSSEDESNPTIINQSDSILEKILSDSSDDLSIISSTVDDAAAAAAAAAMTKRERRPSDNKTTTADGEGGFPPIIRPRKTDRDERILVFHIDGVDRALIPVSVKTKRYQVNFSFVQLYRRIKSNRYTQDKVLNNVSKEIDKSARFYIDYNEWSELALVKSSSSSSSSSKKEERVNPSSRSNNKKRGGNKIRVYVISNTAIAKNGKIVVSGIRLFHINIPHDRVILIPSDSVIEFNGFQPPKEITEKEESDFMRRESFSRTGNFERKLTSILSKRGASLYKDGRLVFKSKFDIPIGVRPKDRIVIRARINGIKRITDGSPDGTHILEFTVRASSINTIHRTGIWGVLPGSRSSKTSVRALYAYSQKYSGDRLKVSMFKENQEELNQIIGVSFIGKNVKTLVSTTTTTTNPATGGNPLFSKDFLNSLQSSSSSSSPSKQQQRNSKEMTKMLDLLKGDVGNDSGSKSFLLTTTSGNNKIDQVLETLNKLGYQQFPKDLVNYLKKEYYSWPIDDAFGEIVYYKKDTRPKDGFARISFLLLQSDDEGSKKIPVGYIIDSLSRWVIGNENALASELTRKYAPMKQKSQ